MMSLINLMNRSQILAKEIEHLKSMTIDTPEGILVIRKGGNEQYRYYRKVRLANGTYKEQYIGQGQQETAARMAYKLYAEKKLPELIREKNWIDRWIAEQNRESEAEELLRKRPGIGQLLQSAVTFDKVRALPL